MDRYEEKKSIKISRFQNCILSSFFYSTLQYFFPKQIGKTIKKRPKNDPKTIQKTIQKRSKNDPKTIQKRSKNDPKTIQKRSKNDPKTI